MDGDIWRLDRPSCEVEPVDLEFAVTLCRRSLLVSGYCPGSREPAPVEVTDELACRMIRDHVQAIIEVACAARKYTRRVSA